MKNDIIAIGKLLWDKNLATGFNGNISIRVDSDTILITATKTCLGYLKEKDILTYKLSTDEVLGSGKPSTETLMHTSVYKQFPDITSIVHTHPTYTNGFFLANDTFDPKTFEAKFYLGQVEAIAQTTPSVTHVLPLIDAFKKNNIVVLKNHGVVAIGQDLFESFVLIQELEEQVKMDLVRVHYQRTPTRGHSEALSPSTLPSDAGLNVKASQGNHPTNEKKYKLFSKEQIDEIVKIVNSDAQMQELGSKTAMNMSLAVILDETQQAHRFTFENGKIVQAAEDTNAEFVINAPETIWRAVFNRQIDPFVATTQKKMTLKGDFARISKWYAPCSRIFQLWTQAPVE